VHRNIAFTFNGLRQLGVPETQLALLPKEFQEGMEARAGLLGDVRENHPDHWVLPEWNVDVPPHDVHPERPRVRMSLVDVVVQFTVVEPDGADEWDETHPLYDDVRRFVESARTEGLNVMSRQLMRNRLDPESGRPRDHFGFTDGISQPRPNASGRDGVKLGEILLGYENDRRDPAFADEGGGLDAATLAVRGSLLDNGTFLVLRKLEQHVDRVRPIGTPVLEKMLGRRMDGTPLVPAARAGDLNDFDYTNDPQGRQCPLQAHIRRANPRNGSDTVRVPRILRRGMSYGPSPDDSGGADTADRREGTSRPSGPERGLMFMAYNASIAEQYEVIQRWLTGGNSTGLFSGMRDPITAVPDVPQPGTFRHFADPSGGPPIGRPGMPAAPLVSLRWGTYLFVPSFAAVQQITVNPVVDVRRLAAEQAAAGGAVMARLHTSDEWAAIYEDSTAINSGITEAVSAAIRSRHGGVRRTPYGVIVTSERLVMGVLGNDTVFSVSEYRNRLGHSIGQIYLGLDAGDRYDALSYRANAEIQRVSAEMAFRRAWDETLKALAGVLETTQTPALFSLEKLADQALAQMSKAWFGIPDGQTVLEGGRPVPGDTAPRCPFHTLAPSRYIFSSPNPRPPVAAAGTHLGRHLLAGVKAFVSRYPDRRSRRALAQTAPLSAAVFETIGDDSDAVASNLVGLLEGFLPTVYGTFIKTMHLWIGDESLWRLQQDLCEERDADYVHARRVLQEPLEVAMMKHPVPDLLYRTATRDVDLGGLRVRAGERVVLSIVGATSDLRQQGRTSTAPVFGGYRSAAGHPTHACPGYEMAMGVLLGMVAAVLQSATLFPAPHPFLKLGDPRPFLVKAQTAAALPT
jgi:Dyp-type peroxidase family